MCQGQPMWNSFLRLAGEAAVTLGTAMVETRIQ